MTWLMFLLACTPSTSDETEDPSATSSDTESQTGSATESDTEAAATQVLFTTSMGTFTIELDAENAPITVENFLAYVDSGHYDGDDDLGATVFHRVVSDFVVQGGGYTADGTLKDTLDPIDLESDNGLSNVRGTIAMARTNRPNSATCQFYINTVDNTFLDYSATNDGYAVFGTVVDGMDTIDAIEAVEVDGSDQPLEDIVITDAERVE